MRPATAKSPNRSAVSLPPGAMALSHSAWAPQNPEAATDALQDAWRRLARMEAALSEATQALRDAHHALALSEARESVAWRTATRDALTGLPNRMAFEERLTAQIADHAVDRQGFCLLFVDLDGFKAVNDQHGHAAGDVALKIIGARLVHALRGEDWVSRYGGDEFVCLLPQVVQEAHAQIIVRKLMRSVAAPCRIGAVSVRLSASVGLAMFPEDAGNVADLVARADRAMLTAKSQRSGLVAGARDPVAGWQRQSVKPRA